MQIKQFQFGTQNETKTSIFYISGKVLGASYTFHPKISGGQQPLQRPGTAIPTATAIQKEK